MRQVTSTSQRSVPRPLYDTDRELWWAMVDAVKLRARGRCEWCGLRSSENTHHRFGYGEETLSCLMAVCRPCHTAIHGRHYRRSIAVAPGSLADLGDSGLGNTSLWRNYLESRRA